MAFGTALNADDEEQKKQGQQDAFTAAPAANSFGAPPPTTGGTGTATAPPKTQAQGGGSGFVNLGRYIDNAANDRGGRVKQQGGAVVDAAKASFDTAAKPLQDAESSLVAPTQQEIDGAWDTNNNDQLTNWANTSYNGPMSMDWAPDMNQFTNLTKLIGADTGLKQAYGAEQASGPYSLGNEMLDQAIFRGDGAVAKAQADVGKSGSDFLDKAKTDQTALNEKGAGFQKRAEDIRNGVRSGLQSRLDSTLAGLDDRVRQTRNAERDRAAGFGYDGVHNTTRPGPGMSGNYKEATGLNREGLATGAERADFARLASILGLGSPVIGEGPGYNPGYFEYAPTTELPEETQAGFQAAKDNEQAEKNSTREAQRKRNRGIDQGGG